MKQLRDDPVAWPILAERARALATQETATATAPGAEILIFRLGDGGYSLPAQCVREVLPLEHRQIQEIDWSHLIVHTPPCPLASTLDCGSMVYE